MDPIKYLHNTEGNKQINFLEHEKISLAQWKFSFRRQKQSLLTWTIFATEGTEWSYQAVSQFWTHQTDTMNLQGLLM